MKKTYEEKKMKKVNECEWYNDTEIFALFASDVYFALDEKELQAVADEWEVDVKSIDVEMCADFMSSWDD